LGGAGSVIAYFVSSLILIQPLGVHGLRITMVSRIFASWNQLDGWLRQIEDLRFVA
jgi:hypothetical protein